MGYRRQCSDHTGLELTTVMGTNQSAATLAVERQLTEHSTGSLTYSYSPAQGGLGLEVGTSQSCSPNRPPRC